MNEFFRYFSNEQAKDTKPSWKTSAKLHFSKKELANAFDQMYMETLRTYESTKTYKGGNVDTILGTSKGFMKKLRETFEDNDNKITCPDNFKEQVYFYLFELNPKCMMDILWIGHFLGSKSMHNWINGDFKMELPSDGSYTDE